MTSKVKDATDPASVKVGKGERRSPMAKKKGGKQRKKETRGMRQSESCTGYGAPAHNQSGVKTLRFGKTKTMFRAGKRGYCVVG